MTGKRLLVGLVRVVVDFKRPPALLLLLALLVFLGGRGPRLGNLERNDVVVVCKISRGSRCPKIIAAGQVHVRYGEAQLPLVAIFGIGQDGQGL